MGNALAAPAPKQRAARAEDLPEKERRQVHREVGLARTPIDVGLRRNMRKVISSELTSRPATAEDIQQIRQMLLSLAPPCPDRSGDACTMPPPFRTALSITEVAYGRTLTNGEVHTLMSIITEAAPVLNPTPHEHRSFFGEARGSLCSCGAPGCPECGAGRFLLPRIPDIPMNASPTK